MNSILKKFGYSKNYKIINEEVPNKITTNMFSMLENDSVSEDENCVDNLTEIYLQYDEPWFDE